MTTHPIRTWWPDFLLDEIMPPGKPTPAEWLEVVDGKLRFVAPAQDDGEAPAPLPDISDGETIEFSWAENLGERGVTVRGDGSYTVTGDVPEDYTSCWEPCAPDTLSDTLADLAEMAAGDISPEDDETTLTVRFDRWGDGAFRVTIADGKPVLTPVTGDAR